MDKPRIKRRNSITLGRWVWECSGSGSMGIADDPRHAYAQWNTLRFIRKVTTQRAAQNKG